jgi:hypothetical protein
MMDVWLSDHPRWTKPGIGDFKERRFTRSIRSVATSPMNVAVSWVLADGVMPNDDSSWF